VGEKDLNAHTVEYNNILQQAVQEIRTARIAIAKQVNSSIQSTYWNLGKLLFDKQLEEGYGSVFMHDISWQMKNCEVASQFCLRVIRVFFLRKMQIFGQVISIVIRGGELLGVNFLKMDGLKWIRIEPNFHAIFMLKIQWRLPFLIG